MFSSDNDWRRRWPEVLAGIDALVVFGSLTRASDLQVVGHGVAAEVADALAAGIPIYGLGERGQPIGPMPVGVELKLLPEPLPAEWALLNFSGRGEMKSPGHRIVTYTRAAGVGGCRRLSR
jgi:hypothetical protein